MIDDPLAAQRWLLAAGCRLSIDQTPDAVTLTVSRPGAALVGTDGAAYTVRIRRPTLEAALQAAGAWVARAGAGAAEAGTGDRG